MFLLTVSLDNGVTVSSWRRFWDDLGVDLGWFKVVLGGFSVVLDPPKNHLIFPSFPLKVPLKAVEGAPSGRLSLMSPKVVLLTLKRLSVGSS